MTNNNPRNIKPQRKTPCDWTDKDDFLANYRNLNFYVNHGMTVTETKRIMSFRDYEL